MLSKTMYLTTHVTFGKTSKSLRGYTPKFKWAYFRREVSD